MKLFSIIKTRKPKGFNFTPRFYDERREALQNRIEAKKQELSGENKQKYADRITASFAEMRRRNKSANNVGRLQMTFIVLFFAVFIIYAYYGDIAFALLLLIAPLYWIAKRKGLT
ncbi:MAG: hypothetical protein EAZ55_06215 [Cytophagales bacterium]|nr:MAG: hypothetical protein EAZ55_06215 [Cytophagales bacterium]